VVLGQNCTDAISMWDSSRNDNITLPGTICLTPSTELKHVKELGPNANYFALDDNAQKKLQKQINEQIKQFNDKIVLYTVYILKQLSPSGFKLTNFAFHLFQQILVSAR